MGDKEIVGCIKDGLLHWMATRAPDEPSEKMKEGWAGARAALLETAVLMKLEYTRLSWRFSSDPDEFKGHILTSLAHLISLKKVWIRRTEDTYYCCLALHRFTKYLACDDRHKDRFLPSKDERFKRAYVNNYGFRRRWVAFLKQIVEFVLLMYADETGTDGLKFYEDGMGLTALHPIDSRLKDYVWATIIQGIATAQHRIDEEPSQPSWTNRLPFDWKRNRQLEVDDLLQQLQQLT